MLLLLIYAILGLPVANGQTFLYGADVTIISYVDGSAVSTISVVPSTTIPQIMPPTATQGFDISLVNSSMLRVWCFSQVNVCPYICSGSASVNYCDLATVAYSCECSNGTVPDCSAFQHTIPFYICEERYVQCVENSSDISKVEAQCQANQQCGTRNATAEAIAAESAAVSSTSTSTLSISGSYTTSSHTSLMTTDTTATDTITTNSMTRSSTRSQPGSSTSSSVPAAISSSAPSSLPAGAYAGIGIGATLAVIIVIAIACLLFRRHLCNRRTQPIITSESQQNTQTSSSNDYGKPELQGDSRKEYDFAATVQQKPDMQTTSNRYEAEAPLISTTTTRSQPTVGWHEVYGDTVSYQQN